MTVFDAYAIVALLRGEPVGEQVANLLARTDRRPAISAANVAEVVDVLVRLGGRTVDEVTEKLDWLAAGGLASIPVSDATARRAGELRARFYDRTSPLSLADCLALATAADIAGDDLATADAPLAAAARGAGCRVIELRND